VTVIAGVGMAFTGPAGWVVLGTVMGAGSSAAVNSIQQASDSS